MKVDRRPVLDDPDQSTLAIVITIVEPTPPEAWTDVDVALTSNVMTSSGRERGDRRDRTRARGTPSRARSRG
jgi:hypothetical protein